MKDERDLAGIYVTDDFLDVIVGSDTAPRKRKLHLSELSLEFDLKARVEDEDDSEVFTYEEYDHSVDRTFDAACDWILSHTSNLRSVGIACYGPFETLDSAARESHDPAYGRLLKTSHGFHLSNRSLVELLESGFRKSISFRTMPLITVATDVAAAVTGEVYNRSENADGTRQTTVDLQTIAFIKVSRGIGGAFMRAAAPWYGRYHPEMGQIHLPRWRIPTPTRKVLRELEFERTWINENAKNPDSVEALASVHAINERFYPATFEELQEDPTHIAWDREAWYLAQLAWTLTCIVAPHCIVFGGRVMATKNLLDRVRSVFEERIAGKQVDSFPSHPPLDEYLTAASERHTSEVGRPGIIGALCISAMGDRPDAVQQHRGDVGR